jgi:hypothetical protein
LKYSAIKQKNARNKRTIGEKQQPRRSEWSTKMAISPWRTCSDDFQETSALIVSFAVNESREFMDSQKVQNKFI